MTDKLVIDVVVNEVGSWDGKPRVSFVSIARRMVVAGKTKKGKKIDPGGGDGNAQLSAGKGEPLADFNLDRPSAQWFGKLLYRKVRITFEDAGQLEPEQYEAQQLHLSGHSGEDDERGEE